MASLPNKEPSANRMLTRKWRETDLQAHYARVVTQKPQVVTYQKTNFPHLIVKPKKIQLTEGKQQQLPLNL